MTGGVYLKKNFLKSKYLRMIALLMIIVMTFLSLRLSKEKVPTYAAVTADDVKEQEEKLEEAKERVEEYADKIDSLAGNITDIKTYIGEVDAMLSDLSANIYNLNQQIASKQLEIDDKRIHIETTKAAISMLQAEIVNTQNELVKAQETEILQYESMKLRIQYMYENGDNSFIDKLFSSESMIDFLNNAEYIAEISEYDREKLVEYAENKDNIATMLANLQGQESELIIQQANLEAEEVELVNQEALLQSMKSQVEAEEASYNSIKAAKANELQQKEGEMEYTEQQKLLAEQEVEDQKAIVEQTKKEYQAWLAQLAAQNQNASEAIKAKLAEIGVTGFTWPVPGYNYITSEFGGRIHPILGIYKLHDGMDISGGGIDGKPIIAAYGGTVVLSRSYYGYGNCVKIDHGGGIQTLYAHASALLVTEGQKVNAGDTIALVGSTGNSTGPHLHLSLIIGGEFVNPRDYFVIPKY